MTSDVIGGLVRHILTTAGGVLAAKGLIESGQVELIAGAVATLIGVAWSIWNKKAKANG